MLVEFERYAQPTEGEDDGLGSQAMPRTISINPKFVSAFFESTQQPGVSLIRMSDGRGFSVRGSYAEIKEALTRTGALNEEADADAIAEANTGVSH